MAGGLSSEFIILIAKIGTSVRLKRLRIHLLEFVAENVEEQQDARLVTKI